MKEYLSSTVCLALALMDSLNPASAVKMFIFFIDSSLFPAGNLKISERQEHLLRYHHFITPDGGM